jgi:hypothetical protein
MSSLSFARKIYGFPSCFGLMALLAGPCLAKSPALQSSAATLAGKLTLAGVTLPMTAVAAASGNTLEGPYSAEFDVASVGQIFYLPSQNNPRLGIAVQATNIATTASGSASGSAFAAGSASLSAAGITILPPASTGGAPYLSLMITNASATAGFMPTTGGSGGATPGSIVVTGSWLKGKTYTAPLNTAPNTVLFEKDGVAVTLNAQIPVKPLGCGETCATLPQGRETDAVRISVSNVTIEGQAISGNVEIGQAIAN